MKILILGGTRFLGRHIAQEALRRGYAVTLFNRGNNNEVFRNVEILLGDRDGTLKALKGRKWDAVIDTCGFVPRTVSKAAKVLGDNINHYTYISSISVYKDWIPLGITESYPVQTMSAEEADEVTKDTAGPVYEYYGPLKALCEQEAQQQMPGKVLNVRAGQIVGSFDYTDRLPYWVKRVAMGGRILCPGNPDKRVQLIDVRDMATWILEMAKERTTGTYNVTGPNYSLTMNQLLETCKQVTESDAEFVWVQEEFLLENDVVPWVQMPLWLPENTALPGEMEPWKGASDISINKAVQQGLSFRPLEETIYDIWEWEQGRQDNKRKAGLPPEREQELLELWTDTKTH
ncbi:NAD-dependent epimerase/dehydratase family protein [Ectobacillus panaciterrae]|uniref:NAD-dependent epimerase/dehydratase family protein n=1 Tax=Ectobacillus panaciterrae TaxID=363872 RepID=UPI0003F6E356|nr:NAD-dependent epimerase/dehydratase family protein [Ectobacillus panaciterrae]